MLLIFIVSTFNSSIEAVLIVTVSDIFILPKEAVPAKLTSELELITPVTLRTPPIDVSPPTDKIPGVENEPNEAVEISEPLIDPM